jgi:hypothetical protein
MSLAYLRKAVEQDDFDKLIRYVRLHFGDGDEGAGRLEIDKAWVEALKLLIRQPAINEERPAAVRELPTTNQTLIHELVDNQSPETLAHIFFYLHFYLVKRSGEWIHDGEL